MMKMMKYQYETNRPTKRNWWWYIWELIMKCNCSHLSSLILCFCIVTYHFWDSIMNYQISISHKGFDNIKLILSRFIFFLNLNKQKTIIEITAFAFPIRYYLWPMKNVLKSYQRNAIFYQVDFIALQTNFIISKNSLRK